MKYKLALFDFDGTIFDTGEGIIKSVKYSAEAFGYEVADINELRCFVGPPLYISFMSFFGVDREMANLMVDKYRERYSGVGLLECSLYDGMVELVEKLKSLGIICAVATGKPTSFTKQILELNGLADLFDYVLGSEPDGTRLSKADCIRDIMDIYGDEAVVMIGDRDNDVLGAKANNVPCIGVSWGYAVQNELLDNGAVCVVDTAEELENILIG